MAYFDGPGGTQVPRAVADAVADYLLHHNATARWATPTSRETDAVIAGARQAMADLLGAEPHEVAFVSSNPWEAYGAQRFGFRVFWVNRSAGPAEYWLDQTAVILPDLAALPERLA